MPGCRRSPDELQLSETACWPEDDAHRLRWFTPRSRWTCVGTPRWRRRQRCGPTATSIATRRPRFSPVPGRWCADASHRARSTSTFRHINPNRRRPRWNGRPSAWPSARADPRRTGPAPQGFLIAVLDDAAAVRSARFDPSALALRGPSAGAHRPGDGNLDVVGHVFAPTLGIAEDAVTGSAHAVLAPYWAHRQPRHAGMPPGVTTGWRPAGDHVPPIASF